MKLTHKLAEVLSIIAQRHPQSPSKRHDRRLPMTPKASWRAVLLLDAVLLAISIMVLIV